MAATTAPSVALSNSLSPSSGTAPMSSSSIATSAAASSTLEGSAGSGQSAQGISLNKFLGALVVSIIVFAVQIAIFFLLRNKLARIL